MVDVGRRNVTMRSGDAACGNVSMNGDTGDPSCKRKRDERDRDDGDGRRDRRQHNAPSRTSACKPQMRMSGFSKVEMSALPPVGRDRGDGDVDHGGTGALGGADAACRAAPDTTAGRRT